MPQTWTITGVITRARRETAVDAETVFELVRDPAPMLLAAALPALMIGLALLVNLPGPVPSVPIAVTVVCLIVLLPLVHAMFGRVRESLAAAGGLARDPQGLPQAWEKTPWTHALLLATPMAVFAGLATGCALGLVAVDQPVLALIALATGVPALVAVLARVGVAPLIAAEEPGISTRALLAASLERSRPCAGRLFGLMLVFALLALLVAAIFGGLIGGVVMLLHTELTGAMPLLLVLAQVALIGLATWTLGALWLICERAIQLAWTAETGGVARLRFAAAVEEFEPVKPEAVEPGAAVNPASPRTASG